jgi:hypothetical protein
MTLKLKEALERKHSKKLENAQLIVLNVIEYTSPQR